MNKEEAVQMDHWVIEILAIVDGSERIIGDISGKDMEELKAVESMLTKDFSLYDIREVFPNFFEIDPSSYVEKITGYETSVTSYRYANVGTKFKTHRF